VRSGPRRRKRLSVFLAIASLNCSSIPEHWLQVTATTCWPGYVSESYGDGRTQREEAPGRASDYLSLQLLVTLLQ